MSMRLPGINGQEKSPAPSGTPAGGDSAGTDGQSSFIAELAGAGAQNLAPLPTKSRFGGFMLLGVIMLVAAGVLVGMRFLGTKGVKQLLNIKIDYPIGDVLPDTADHSSVLRELKDSGSVVQVPLEKIQQNPFSWNGFEEPEPVAKGPREPDPAELSRQAAAQRQQKIKNELAQFKLNSVMGGSRPMARISGTLHQVGDKIGEYFVIKSIAGRSVEVTADGQSYTLSMDE